MRIMFFSHYYPPEVNAPASRTSEHCSAWANAGHEVTVVTCVPNHPSGRVYRGYRNRLCQTETVDGVRVVRVWTFLAANEGVVLRTFNYLSYLISAAAVLPWLPRPDVVVSTSPQFFCGLVGIIARSLFKAPWVLEIRDLWPESIVAVGAMRKGLVVRLLERPEALAYRSADRIVSVTHSFVSHIVARGIDSSKIAVIKNGADLQLFTKLDMATGIKTRLGLQNRFVAGYVGTHGMAHGLSVVLEAAERLRHDPRIAFLLVGDGAERANLEQIREKQRLDNVVILGQRPKEEMPSFWAAIDASLILLRREDLFKKVIPSKMFEAMAMRCPIVLGVEGEARALLDEAGAGIAITPESAEELAAAVVRLAENPALAGELGDRGCAYVREHHDRARLATRYLDLLGEVVTGFRARIAGKTGHALPG
jgi:glycosyltransferase involved in cell wall biosynthesis